MTTKRAHRARTSRSKERGPRRLWVRDGCALPHGFSAWDSYVSSISDETCDGENCTADLNDNHEDRTIVFAGAEVVYPPKAGAKK